MKYTLDELLELVESDEGKQQIRVIVAEICGWQKGVWSSDCFRGDGWLTPGKSVYDCAKKTGLVAWSARDLPHYETSLDVMAEAEWTLKPSEWLKYPAQLRTIINREVPGKSLLDEADMNFALVMSGAIIRAIAFILIKQEVQL